MVHHHVKQLPKLHKLKSIEYKLVIQQYPYNQLLPLMNRHITRFAHNKPTNIHAIVDYVRRCEFMVKKISFVMDIIDKYDKKIKNIQRKIYRVKRELSNMSPINLKKGIIYLTN